MLDVHAAPFLEMVALTENSVYHNVFERADLNNNAKHLIEYVKRFTSHDLIRKFKMSKKANDKHQARSRAWDKSQKCQLSLEVLHEALEDS
jgi:hypothetical protein